MQDELDSKNAEFWEELCGTSLAVAKRINVRGVEGLREFDRAYLEMYPYLPRYVEREAIAGKRVLEIGLGYGTLGQLLASKGALYHGLDIARQPVEMMKTRLRLMSEDPGERVRVGSALEIPHRDASFEFVYSIGCLHHTGDILRSVQEVRRVLVPGGKAIVMLYNANSFRRAMQRLGAVFSRGAHVARKEKERASYDANSKGLAAPHVDFVSRREVRRKLFVEFSRISIEAQNFDSYYLRPKRGLMYVDRSKFLSNIARICGLDLYITAVK